MINTGSYSHAFHSSSEDDITRSDQPLFKRILIVTDGSKLVENVVEYGARNIPGSDFFNSGMGNTKAVGTALNTRFLTSVLENMARKAVDKTIKQMKRNGLKKVQHRIAIGAPLQEVEKYISEKRIDLMIIGLESQLGARNFAFGKLKEKMIRSTKCPVLIINSYIDSSKKIDKILNPTDGKTHSDAAELMSFIVAQGFDAQICKLFIGKDKELGRKIIQRARGRAITRDINEVFILDITDDNSAKRIFKIAPNYDLIIMGKGKRRLFGGDDLSLIVKEVIALSPTPVLLVGNIESTRMKGR